MTRFVSAAPTYSIPTLSERLRKREASYKTTTIMLLVGGLAWLVVAIAFLATIPWGMQFGRHGKALTPSGSWPWYFAMTAAVAGPIMFALEHATRGKMIDEASGAFQDANPFQQRLMGRGMMFVVIIEMGLWGPRSIVSAFRRIAGSRSMAGADRSTAAGILANLLRGNDGLPTGQALAGLPADASSDALAYLAYYDWVDIAKDGTRVWILSEAKKHLRA